MIPIEWARREEPLIPEAVLLPRKALAIQPTAVQGREMRGVASPSGLLVVGAPERLPWLVGASYFARSPDAPDIYIPTGLKPQVAEVLMARAVRCRAESDQNQPGPVNGPFLVIPASWAESGSVIICLGGVSVIDSDELTSWLRAA